MSKLDLKALVADVQKLYKDEKSKAMVVLGSSVKEAYTIDDGVPVPKGHPLFELVGLPCVPYNKIIQCAGEADTGKSTFCGQLMASAQATDHLVIILDSEDKFDANRYRKHFGGDPDGILLVKTNEILQGAEKVRQIILEVKKKHPKIKILFVWDSVGGSQSRSHAERKLDDEKHSQPGQDAKENASVMKMLVSLINKFPDTIATILANQVYAKIGFMQVGNAASGGKKIEFHSSLIIHLKRIKTLTKTVKGVVMKTGIITRATVTKNHLSQSELSVHKLDFEITAAGANVSSNQSVDDGEE